MPLKLTCQMHAHKYITWVSMKLDLRQTITIMSNKLVSKQVLIQKMQDMVPVLLHLALSVRRFA